MNEVMVIFSGINRKTMPLAKREYGPGQGRRRIERARRTAGTKRHYSPAFMHSLSSWLARQVGVALMGLNIHALRLMLHAKEQGADFERVVTIGRLDVLVTPGQLEEEFAAFRDPLKPGEAMQLIQAEDRFCEPIIKRIGARTVDALDASDYEGANILHDLNRPLPDEHKKKYSLLLDGGTLEHVFHFPERVYGCPSVKRRPAAMRRQNAMSAVASVSTPGVLPTAMQRAVAAVTSTLLKPTA